LTIVSHIGVSQFDDVRTPAFGAGGRSSGPADSQRMYRRAMRHSRLVRTLRLVIPIGSVAAILAVVVATTLLNPLRVLAKLPVDSDGLVVSGTKITMRKPRLAGFTRDSRPYVVIAKTATQDLLKPDQLELDDINSTMEMQDKTKVVVTAKSGLYDTKNEKLTLQKDVVVVTAKYRALLDEAWVDVRAGHIISEHPVEVTMMQGTVNANRMEVFNSGEIIRFERGVTMVMISDAAGSQTGGR
jgi:lipopolysaccharide export system protein LptC